MTFFCKDHKGENIRRIIKECKEFISGTQIEDLGITLSGQDDAVVIKTVAAEPVWEKAGRRGWSAAWPSGDAPFKAGRPHHQRSARRR